MVANLRRPPGADRPSLVILLPGLDSTKEEFFRWEDVFLARGVATVSLDGPGQGETGYHTHIRPDYEVAPAALLDHLQDRPDLDLDRVGVVGVSLGGYYAPRTAAFEPRVKAVCAIGGAHSFGDVVGRRINRHATPNGGPWHARLLQITVVGANQRRQMSARLMCSAWPA
jgi:pimeloyl-ACP methyl ester carboxylesterase